MSAEVKKQIQLEIAHVLFIDIVGYSKLSINEQHAAVDELTQIVRPVSGVVDVTGQANLTGAGLNLAHRAMECGDAGHILLSKHVAEDLEEYEEWRPRLHDLGTG